ncbi:MAG: FAD-dependent oxidoreductase [Gemmatimonadetes bacterium]|nr:FAD-dependent oxidoreductase [Gemmatimonadota bacterium]
MARPLILTLDDDVNVLRAVERDVRSEYGSEFRVARADSGDTALQMLSEFKKRGDPSALFLVDQRMPGMTGVEFLERAVDLYPEAKRVLLTAYADTDAAIKAINDVQIDYYLLKPWDPPEEKLYPVLTDLLDDWRSAYRPPFEGIRLVGNQWAPAVHRVKDFLARNNIPYLWLDPEQSEEALQLIEASGKKMELPCLFFPDGSMLEKPENREIAQRVGLQTTADRPFYDLVVVGAGPAGLAAAVYGASEGLRTIVVEKQAPGGQAGMSSRIENYLGFPKGLSGGELARRAVSQARRFGVEILTAQEVVALKADGPLRTLRLGDGSELCCRALLIATGVSYRQLQAEGIEKLTGAGVYYGASMSEGESVRGKDVYIVGGANSAGQAAMYFSRFAETVTMLVRRDSLSTTMSQYLLDQIAATDNIRVWTNANVHAAVGSERLEKLCIARDGGQSIETVEASALFIFIGAIPHTDWLGDTVARDPHGFILSGPEALANGATAPFAPLARNPFLLETSLPGVFVAGDVRHGSVKRVASAVGEGSMAVMYVHRYLSSI